MTDKIQELYNAALDKRPKYYDKERHDDFEPDHEFNVAKEVAIAYASAEVDYYSRWRPLTEIPENGQRIEVWHHYPSMKPFSDVTIFNARGDSRHIMWDLMDTELVVKLWRPAFPEPVPEPIPELLAGAGEYL